MRKKILSFLLAAAVAVPMLAGNVVLDISATESAGGAMGAGMPNPNGNDSNDNVQATGSSLEWTDNVCDLQNRTITGIDLIREISKSGKKTVTIKNGSIAGSLGLDSDWNITFSDITAADSTITISKGTAVFESGTYHSVYATNGSADVTIKGGSYNVQNCGVGTGSTMKITGGTFSPQAGIFAVNVEEGANLTIEGGTFNSGIVVDSPNANVVLSGGTYSSKVGTVFQCDKTSDTTVITKWLADGCKYSSGEIVKADNSVQLKANSVSVVKGTADNSTGSSTSTSSSSAPTAADYTAKTSVDGAKMEALSDAAVKNAQEYAKSNNTKLYTVVELSPTGTPDAEGYYTVTITVQGATFNKDTIQVSHFEDGQWKMLQIVSVSGGSVTFKTKSFSPFAVADKAAAEGTSPVDAELGTTTWNGSSFDGAKITSATKNMVTAVSANLKSSELKPSGAADVKANVVSGAAKDNLLDNGVHPAVKKFVENRAKALAGSPQAGKADASNIKGIYYFDLTASQPGDVTFKLEDALTSVMTGDAYAIVLHYTGNAADEDGITAQYCKISSAGKVTAHFNSFSPVAIIATNVESAQTLVNTYSHDAGSDAAGAQPAATTNVPAAAPAVAADATANAAAQPTAGAVAANTTNAAGTKGAASPKTGDTNDLSVLLFLAAAAATVVLTKKTYRA